VSDAIADRSQEIQADETVVLKPCAAVFHPSHRFGIMTQDDVRIVLLDPGFEAPAGDFLQAKRGHFGDIRQVFLKSEKGTLPAKLKPLAQCDFYKKSRAPVTPGIQFAKRRDRRTVMVRADAVRRRTVDELVGVNRGVPMPAQCGEIGKSQSREEDEALNAAGMEDRVEPVEPYAVRTEDEVFDIETQLIGPRGDSGHQGLAVANRDRGSYRFDDLDRRENAPKLLSARSAQL